MKFRVFIPIIVLISLLALASLSVGCSSGGSTDAAKEPEPVVLYLDTSIVVESGEIVIETVLLETGDRIEGSFTIVGGNDDVDFWIKDPFDTIVYGNEDNRVSGTKGFAYTASTDGNYYISFDNSFSWFTNKVVTLNLTKYPNN